MTMWPKIKQFLQQSIPGTPTAQEMGTAIARLFRRLLHLLLIGFPVVFRWPLKWAWKLTPPVLVLLLVWMAGGNLLADQLQKKPDAAVAEFLDQFPPTEPNDSALRLSLYITQLGLDHGFPPTTSGFPSVFDNYYQYMETDSAFRINTSNELTRNESDELSDYFDQLKMLSSNNFPLIPEELSSYLQKNSEIISVIIEHLMTQEIPIWGSDIEAQLGNYELPLPGYFNYANLVRLITLQSIQDFNAKDFEAAATDLDAAWRLHESLKDDPTLIGQLVSLFMGQDILLALKLIQPSSKSWQERLTGRDYIEPILTTIEVDFMGVYSFFNNLNTKSRIEILESEDLPGGSLFWFRFVLPYYKLSSVNFFYFQEKVIEQIRVDAQSPCSAMEGLLVKPPWWNIPARALFPSFLTQTDRATDFMLRAEMTQKLLEAKEQARGLGNWPEQLVDLQSNVCPGERWLYEVNGNTLSLRFSQTPDWLQERIENGDAQPLVYRNTLSNPSTEALDAPTEPANDEVTP